MNMNALVVYWSKFGNTEQIARAIASALPAGSVRVISMDQLTAAELAGPDLVVMGCPTHRMNLPEAVRPLFETLPKRILRDKAVAAYDTSYKMSPVLARLSAAKKLSRKLRKLRGRQVVPPETFYVVDREGPLYDGELERARDWAESILEQIK